jgi:hypothetical protein
MWCGLPGAALIEEDTAVVGGIEVLSVCIKVRSRELYVYGCCTSPVAVINSSSWSAMEVDNGHAFGVTAFFVVD